VRRQHRGRQASFSAQGETHADVNASSSRGLSGSGRRVHVVNAEKAARVACGVQSSLWPRSQRPRAGSLPCGASTRHALVGSMLCPSLFSHLVAQ